MTKREDGGRRKGVGGIEDEVAALASRIGVPAGPSLSNGYANSMIGRLRRQLSGLGFVSVSEVATVCNVSCHLVLSWLKAGQIEGANISSSEKPYFRIYAPSVVKFIEKRRENP